MDYFWEVGKACSVSGFSLMDWVKSEFLMFVLDLDMVVVWTWYEKGCFFIWASIDYIA